MKFFSRLLFAAAVLALPVAAQASTLDLSANQYVSVSGTVSPSEELEFRFNVIEDIDIASFAVSATGNAATVDLAAATFGLTSPPTDHFANLHMIGTATYGGGFLSGMTLMAGDVLSVFFDGGSEHPISVTLSFLTTPTAVPVPASGLLLSGLLLALGTRASRSRKHGVGTLPV